METAESGSLNSARRWIPTFSGLEIKLGVSDVIFRRFFELFDFFQSQIALVARRSSQPKSMRRNDCFFSYQGAGSNQRAFSNDNPVHDERLHAYETSVLQSAAVQDYAVSDGDVVADDQGRAGIIGVFAMGYMQHTQILNIATRADTDGVYVAARHAIVPDAALGADFHIADDNGCLGYERSFINYGTMVLERVDQNVSPPT